MGVLESPAHPQNRQMSEPVEPLPPTQAPAPRPARASSWTYTLALVALILAGAGGWYAYVNSTAMPAPPDELNALKAYITNLATTQKLADGYADGDGDLVADPPTDPAKFLKVDEIVFSVVGSDDPEAAKENWKDFMAALGKATGKKVTYLADVNTTQEQTRALAEGRLHVTAFNTGLVPTAVNTAGFVPLFCPADAAGNYAYRMEILVPAAAAARTPADLRGKAIGLVALSSNSGGKAPLVILKDKFQMLPGRDYTFSFVGDHARAVKDVAAGRYDAVCVASDMFAKTVADPEAKLKPEQFRSVYQSAPFPPLCFGVPHNLPPEVLAGVKKAFVEFAVPNTSVATALKSGQVKFAPVNYKADWQLTREVDDSLTHLLDAK